MPLVNIFLEADGGRIADPAARRQSWDLESLIESPSVETESANLELAESLDQFVTIFPKDEWKDANGSPKEELGLLFTAHRKVLEKILYENQDCAGIRILIAAKNGKTNIILKPVDAKLEELDKLFPERVTFISNTLSECPPENNCPSRTVERFRDILNFRANS